jgi:molecular chaperone DnaK (HSP70)
LAQQSCNEAIHQQKQAIDFGYNTFESIQKDSDPDPLRQREDFKQIVKELEANLKPIEIGPEPREIKPKS